MALVDAVVVGQAKAELLQAAAQLNLHDQTVQRLSGLSNVVAGSRLLEAESAREQAEAAVRKAIQILANLGLQITLEDVRGKNGAPLRANFRPSDCHPRRSSGSTSHRRQPTSIPVLAPRDGVVVRARRRCG